MENPDDYEVDDEGPEVTEEEYQRSINRNNNLKLNNL